MLRSTILVWLPAIWWSRPRHAGCVHQMIGILPDKAREVFGIPEGYEAWTGIAIGYEGDPATLPDNLKQRDLTPRQRKPLKEFVFTGKWGNPAPFLAKR